MKFSSRFVSVVVSLSVLFSLLPLPPAAEAQGTVTNEAVGGGSSAFVFRGSGRQASYSALGGRAGVGNGFANREGSGGGGGGGSRIKANNAFIAAEAKKRRAAAIAKREQLAKAANQKIALSNTLTAKAEKLLDDDKIDPAIAAFRDALSKNPKNGRAANGLSDALTAKGIAEPDSTAALKLFDEAVKYDKQNEIAFAKMGAIYDARGQKDKAAVNYEKALAINPSYKSLYATLGLAYADSGEIAKAEIWSQKATAAGIDTADSRLLKGLVLYKQNKNEEALTAFDKAAELDARSPEVQYHRGQAYDRLGQTDKAIGSYQKALEADPQYTPASFDIGVAYYNAGDYKNAEVAYKQVIASDSGNSQAHANLASTYTRQEKYADANTEFATASKDIHTADLNSEYGYSLGKSGNWDASTEHLKAARDESPTAVDNSNLGWGYYNGGVADTQAKNTEAANAKYSLAKSSLETAVQLDPKLDAAYLNLGSTHNGLGEYQLAVNVLKTALNLHSNWLIAMNQLGLGYRGMNDLTNAVAIFKSAVNLDGNYVNGLFNLGEAYNASGNKKEAKKVNDRLKKLNPALASQLENIFNGKAVVDQTKQQIQNKVPKVPKLPF